MNNEDKKMQKQLVDEMMKVSKTNPDVMIYMQALMESYEKLEKKLDQYKNILEDIDKYIHNFKIENIGEKTMLILNDILLIKNGLGKDVIRLNKMKELEEDK